MSIAEDVCQETNELYMFEIKWAFYKPNPI